MEKIIELDTCLNQPNHGNNSPRVEIPAPKIETLVRNDIGYHRVTGQSLTERTKEALAEKRIIFSGLIVPNFVTSS